MTHTENNCPGYNPEIRAETLAAADGLQELSKELGVKVHFLVTGAPEHVAYPLLEADSLGAISRFVTSMPMPQDCRVAPVEHLADTMAMIREMAEQG
jgi:hypothetical protein